MTFFVIQYVANGQAMSKSTLANAEVDPWDDLPPENTNGAALFENEDEAQQSASDYEYYVIAKGGTPADIQVAKYNGTKLVNVNEVW
jgi:hypothetical protein